LDDWSENGSRREREREKERERERKDVVIIKKGTKIEFESFPIVVKVFFQHLLGLTEKTKSKFGQTEPAELHTRHI
jgi:hypothetical protein